MTNVSTSPAGRLPRDWISSGPHAHTYLRIMQLCVSFRSAAEFGFWLCADRCVNVTLRSRTKCWERTLRRSWETKLPDADVTWMQSVWSRRRQTPARQWPLQSMKLGIKGELRLGFYLFEIKYKFAWSVATIFFNRMCTTTIGVLEWIWIQIWILWTKFQFGKTNLTSINKTYIASVIIWVM